MVFYTNKTSHLIQILIFFSHDFLSLYYIILQVNLFLIVLKPISSKWENESVNYNDWKQIKFWRITLGVGCHYEDHFAYDTKWTLSS